MIFQHFHAFKFVADGMHMTEVTLIVIYEKFEQQLITKCK